MLAKKGTGYFFPHKKGNNSHLGKSSLSPFLPFALLLSFSICLSGCATVYNPATGREELILIDTSSEVAIGNSAVLQIGRRFKLSDNEEDLNRLKSIGGEVAQASDRQDLAYKFYIIEDEKLNAFTIPGGHVYIYKGFYDLLDDDELACVLAHEIGHVAARHVIKKMQASLGYQILSTIVLTQYLKRKEDRKKRTAYIAYAASTAFNLVMLGYSREDEYQADELAVKYAHKAGFNPRGMIGSLEKLKAKKQKGFPVPYILRSHPYIDERIARLDGVIATQH